MAAYTVTRPSGLAHLGTKSVTPFGRDFMTFWALLITPTKKIVLRGKDLISSVGNSYHGATSVCVFFFPSPFCRKSKLGIFFKIKFIMDIAGGFSLFSMFKKQKNRGDTHIQAPAPPWKTSL